MERHTSLSILKNLKVKTINSIYWSISDSVLNVALTMMIGAILARLLRPEDFGVMAVIYVFTGFLRILRDFGIGASIIQKSQPSYKELDSLFWFSIFSGIIVAITLVFSSSIIARFFEIPILEKYIRVISLALFLGSVSIVPESIIRKTLSFKSLFFRNISSLLLSGGVAIFMAYRDYGVWSLIIKEIVFNFLLVFLSFSMIDWGPKFRFSLNSIKSYLTYSFPLFGENALNYFVRNIDNLLVGKLFGSVMLGYYSKAYSLMLLPVRQISGSIANVIFPSLSIIKDDKQKVWEGYMDVVKVVAFINLPAMISLHYFSKEVVLLLFGDQWLEVIPMIKALCVLGSIQSIATLGGSIYNSQGETKLQFKVGLMAKSVISAVIIFGLTQGGIYYMIKLYTLSSVILFLVESYFISKILGKSLLDFVWVIRRELLAVSVYLLTMTLCFSLFSGHNMVFKAIIQIVALSILISLGIRWNLTIVEVVRNGMKKIR